MAELVDLHLVSWNRPKMTELVIRTIWKNTPPNSFVLHVLDNGSSPETVEMLAGLHSQGLIHRLHLQEENKGLEWARHFLMTVATQSPHFVDIDNDCLPPYGWLGAQLDLMSKYEDYAAISQRTQVMIGSGNIFEQADLDGSDIVEFPHPGGSFRLMRADPVVELGGWDRDNPGRGSEERYIGAKLNNAGFKTGFAAEIQCLHLFGDRAKTTERWGYEDGMDPGETGHSDIWHPALTAGDDYEEVLKYSGSHLAMEYFR